MSTPLTLSRSPGHKPTKNQKTPTPLLPSFTTVFENGSPRRFLGKTRMVGVPVLWKGLRLK